MRTRIFPGTPSRPQIPRILFFVVLLLLVPGSPAESQLVREWTLGSLSDPADDFGLLADAALDDQGRTWVLDNVGREVSVYSPGGDLLFSFGRAGDGPGEFREPIHLGTTARGVWVSDGQNSRVTFFDSAGTVLETQDARWSPVASRYPPPAPFAVTPAGAFVSRFEPSSSAWTRSPGMPKLVIVRDPVEGADTLLHRLSYDHSILWVRTGMDRGIISFRLPFSDDPLVSASASGRFLTVVFRHGDDDEDLRDVVIETTDLSTLASERTRLQLPTIPLDPSHRRGALEPYERSDETGRLGRLVEEAMFIPDRITPVRDAVTGEDGSVWLQLHSPGDAFEGRVARWLRVPRGGSEATLEAVLPGRIVWAGEGTVILFDEDEMGVPLVHRYRY